jgi:hypothetical protein
METTKTVKLQRIVLPLEIVDLLRWHVRELPQGPMRESELLFPTEIGGYRAGSCLDHPFEEVAKKPGLKQKVTPRVMRRTFQDLARAAEVRDIVTRSISGHSTEAMQRHYSTVSGNEQKEGLAKVVGLARFREAARIVGDSDLSGEISAEERAETETAVGADLQTAVASADSWWGVKDSDPRSRTNQQPRRDAGLLRVPPLF